MGSGPQLFNLLPRKLPGYPKWPFRANRKSHQAQGLKAWFPLQDLRGRDNFGTFSTTYVGNVKLVPNAFGGRAIDFNGTGRFNLTNVGDLITADFDRGVTISIWGRGTVSETDYFISVHRNISATGYYLKQQAAQSRWNVEGATTEQLQAGNGNLLIKPYFHLVGTYANTGDMNLYHDGVRIDTDTGLNLGSIVNTTNQLTIGAGTTGGGDPTNAHMWDVRFYSDRAMNQDEVLDLYHNPYELMEEYGQRTYIFPAHFPAPAAAAANTPLYLYHARHHNLSA